MKIKYQETLHIFARNLLLIFSGIVSLDALGLEETKIYNAQPSPNGHWIAESIAYENGNKGGQLILRNTENELPAPHTLLESSTETRPDVFFIWKDDDHLTVKSEDTYGNLSGLSQINGIQIEYATYPAQKINESNYTHSTTYKISDSDISALFIQESHLTSTSCTLTLKAISTTTDDIGMTIIGGDKSCVISGNNPIKCKGLSSNIWIEKKQNTRTATPLTFTTISKIPSFSNTPYGEGQQALRGGFLADNAEKLLTELSKNHFEINLSFNFSEEEKTYEIPTKSIKNKINEFNSCITGKTTTYFHGINLKSILNLK